MVDCSPTRRYDEDIFRDETVLSFVPMYWGISDCVENYAPCVSCKWIKDEVKHFKYKTKMNSCCFCLLGSLLELGENHHDVQALKMKLCIILFIFFPDWWGDEPEQLHPAVPGETAGAPSPKAGERSPARWQRSRYDTNTTANCSLKVISATKAVALCVM